jgi:hypothetical protein
LFPAAWEVQLHSSSFLIDTELRIYDFFAGSPLLLKDYLVYPSSTVFQAFYKQLEIATVSNSLSGSMCVESDSWPVSSFYSNLRHLVAKFSLLGLGGGGKGEKGRG